MVMEERNFNNNSSNMVVMYQQDENSSSAMSVLLRKRSAMASAVAAVLSAVFVISIALSPTDADASLVPQAFVKKQYIQLPPALLVRGGASLDDYNEHDEDSGNQRNVEVYDNDDGEEDDEEQEEMTETEDEDDDTEWEQVEGAETVEDEEELMDDEEEVEVELTEMPQDGETTVEEKLKEIEVEVESMVDEVYPGEGAAYHEEMMVRSRVEEDDVRLVAGTTDGELADDEGMDSMTTPEDAAELVSVTAGGAVLAAEGDAGGLPIDDAVVEEVVAAELEEDIEVTDEMKDVLRNELKYTARDVKMMRPEIAAMVVYNKLLRPIEGMPRNWYVEGSGPAGPLRENALKIAAAIAVLGAGAALSLNGGISRGIDLSEFVDNFKKVPSSLASFSTSFTKQAKDKAEEAATVVQEALDSDATFSDGEMKEMENEVPRSIKPGSRPSLTGNEDKTALDKFLSKIENMIKGFFRIKI